MEYAAVGPPTRRTSGGVVAVRVEARSCVEPAGDEWEHARRLEKSLKSGVVDGSELSTYDVGLLRRYRPWTLVSAGVEYE